jgi:hypothetical protein
MEKNYTELRIGGIKCDSCDFTDNTVKESDYHSWVNEPCPKCGANLLTEEDYEMSQVLHNAIDFMNTLSPEEIMEISKLAKLHDVFNDDVFADAKGKEHLESDGLVDITLDVHNGIRVTEIKPNKEQEAQVSDTTKAD